MKYEASARHWRSVVRFLGRGVAVGCNSGRGSIPSTNAADSGSVPEKQSGNSRVSPSGSGTSEDWAVVRSFKLEGPIWLKERSAELQLCDSGRESKWRRRKLDFVHAIDLAGR